MNKPGKKFIVSSSKVDKSKKYKLEDGINLAKSLTYVKYNETLDIAVRLGIDQRQPEQNVRGSVVLPHGIGKKLRVLVFCKGDKVKEANEAGADFAGAEEFIEKIQEGWLEFDSVISTPDLMGSVGKLGKILGPRGLMPNPKTGTVTFDVAKIIKEMKLGRIEFKLDKAGIIHAPLGKINFSVNNLIENCKVFLEAIMKLKPHTSKGDYLKSISISSTMGPGIRLDHLEVGSMFQ
jgi:large subunit ribosomal protein L1